MEFLSSLFYFGYFTTGLYIINLLILTFLHKNIIKPCLEIVIILCIIFHTNLFVNFQPYGQGVMPSVREFIINFALALLQLFYIYKLEHKSWFNIIAILFSVSWYFFIFYCIYEYLYSFVNEKFIAWKINKLLICFIFLFYSFVIDLLCFRVFKILYHEIKFKKKTLCILFILLYVCYIITYGNFINNYIFPTDLRSDNVIYLKTIYESDTLNDYIYELHNINDTECRLKKIIKVFDGNIQNGRYYFLEDTTAALTFCRNYIDNIWNDYSYNMEDYYSVLSINYADNMFLENFNCRCDSISFKIVSSGNNLIIIKGDFDDLTLKRFCAFQKFLSDEISDLANHKIVLYNKNNDFKIGIRYFTNNEYKLYLDKSFL